MFFLFLFSYCFCFTPNTSKNLSVFDKEVEETFPRVVTRWVDGELRVQVRVINCLHVQVDPESMSDATR